MEFTSLLFENMKVHPFPINISQGLYVYRASGNNPKLTESPRWFSDAIVTGKYHRKYKTNVYACELKKNIKLMDIRVLRHLIIEIIINNENLMYKINTDINFYNKVKSFMIAFGLKDRLTQMIEIENVYIQEGKNFPYRGRRYNNNIEPFKNFGSRISLGSVDDKAVELMKELVGNYIHGYISPKLKTQWHQHNDNYFDNEICLFNPKECLEESLEIYTGEIENFSGQISYLSIEINDIIDNNYYKNMELNTYNDIVDIVDMDMEYSYSPENIIVGDYMNLNTNYSGGYNNEILNELEINIEKSTTLQCDLSRQVKLKKFICNIFIDLTFILYDSFKIAVYNNSENNKQEIINNIYYHYRPIYDFSDNIFYVLKPGISNKGNNLIEKILNNDKDTDSTFKKYTINELMGSIYGILTHGGMFTLIFKASIKVDDINNNLYNLKNKFKNVINGIKNLFSLNDSFTENKFNDLLSGDELLQENADFNGMKVYDVRKGNMRNIIMDMMVNNPQSINNISIVRKNLNNQDYIRTRRSKQINQSSRYSKTSNQSDCPKFFTDNVKQLDNKVLMVDGDEWYEVTANGFFNQIMKENGRIAKAGPSGSTFMWMNMIFGLMGMKSSEENYKLLLLCIICDFVPVYHSLTEVIMIYSKENPYVKENEHYNIKMNPVEWLIKHFELNEGNINSVDDLSKELQIFIEKTKLII